MNKSLVNSPLKLGLALLVIAGITGCTSRKQELPLGRVERDDLVQRVTLSGNIEPARKTIIQVSYEGFVRKLYVELGQKVKKDDPLVSVAQSLHSTEPAFPLRAPYDGYITQVYKKEGEYLSTGQDNNRVLRLDDLSKLYVDISAPEIEVAKIKNGMEATIRASAVLDRTYKGVIREISIAARDQDRWSKGQVQYPCTVQILDADKELKPGMSVNLDIIVGRRENVLTLGHEFIGREGDNYFVTLKDGTRRNIKVGAQNEEAFEILSGLNEGDEARMIDFMDIIRKGS